MRVGGAANSAESVALAHPDNGIRSSIHAQDVRFMLIRADSCVTTGWSGSMSTTWGWWSPACSDDL